ncbi:type II toxin-antitoxin system RatA family toxin [Candidatus Berkiella cookevillensis]|uniref:Persistence and stress-resistance toxin PasT n=1 Tax=Candidatus Berkiella cookevillensis TaxID=437022 RepID=A0A0Q9YRL9_9GAMM|nr:type II toxin-antitoxin system RatA family toxin [Candidatus Berkiella cookevillensis]MCS5707811.1 type II toxin-antitoxin system RatA family toxin [Candidatus Berkiella cookevillensis]
MPIITQQQILPYHAADMYALVNDIERYPEFLPMCVDAKILSKTENELCATLFIQKGPLQFSFSTRNNLIVDKQVEMLLLDGPFEYLRGKWVFTDRSQGSDVNLKLDFEMKNTLLKLTLGPVFSALAYSMVEIFSKRAKKLYD